jgi:peroxiredoxin/protocatechuate 3,4-dioxygenase beta subunit
MWKGVDLGGRRIIKKKVEGDITGEIFVGFFSDVRWWVAPPVQVRRFPGPGRYTVERLMPGKYYVGAMIGSLPRPEAFGVHRNWPAPVGIKTGKTLSVDLLVSTDFEDRVCHPNQYEGFAGQFGTLDPVRLITLRTVDHRGNPTPFCRVTYRDQDRSSHAPFHDIGTDEEGYSYCGKMDGPFSLTTVRYDFLPENFAQLWQIRRFEETHNTAERETITVQWPPYPTGTAKVKGRVHDQHGQPLKQYYLTLKHTEKGQRLGSEDWFAIGYKVPVTDPNGRFEIDHLPPGEFRWMVRSFDYPAYAYDFDMGRFTISEEDNAVTELDLEVEAKELLHGCVVYEDGSPVHPGMHIARFGEDDYFALNMEKDGSFRVCLSKQEREDLLKNRSGMVEIKGKTGEKWHALGQVHIDKLSKDPNNPAKIVFPGPKAETSEIPAAGGGTGDKNSRIATKSNSKERVSTGELSLGDTGGWLGSRAWYVLRQIDSRGLLHGLPQRLGKAIVPSKRQTPMWQGVDDGGRIDLEIRVEGEVTGEVFVGFFSHPRWWVAGPVQVRHFPGPGRYAVERLIPGKYCVGAMIGSLPVPDVLGVDASWPAPIEIEKGKTCKVRLLLSTEFKNNPCGQGEGMQKGFSGQFDVMDPARSITLRTIDHTGKPLPFCRVTFVERDRDDPSRNRELHPWNGTDEKGYTYFDKIDGPFSITVQRFDFLPGRFAELWQSKRFDEVHYTKDRKSITVQWQPFPTGTGKATGRMYDQHGRPLKEYYLTLWYDVEGTRTGASGDYRGYWDSVGYKVPVRDAEGRFEIKKLPAGEYTVMVRAFDFATHVYDHDMGQFTIPDETDAAAEFALEVEAKELLYGHAFYEDGSPVYPGWASFGLDKAAETHWAVRTKDDGSFRICLSKQERKDRIKVFGGIVKIKTKPSWRAEALGQIHIDKLSNDRNNPAKIVVPRPKAESSETPAAGAGTAERSGKIAKKADSQKVVESAAGAPEQQSSRVWYMLRQWNVGPLLLGLTQQFGKVIVPSQRSEAIWTGADDEGAVKINIAVEGDVKGEIFVGFFDDATWSSEPVQVRSFPGPGSYLVKNLPYGGYQIGAMIGNLPVAKALGVHRRWPEPVLVERGIISGAKVLVSPDFQNSASVHGGPVLRDYIGDWDEMDPDNLLRGCVTGPSGRGVSFAGIRIREHKDDPKKGGIMILDRGTDERGYYFFDDMEWPYNVTARWYQSLPSVLGCRYQDLWFNKVLEGSQTVDFKFEDFPTGTSSLTGRVVDQHGNAIREFIIKIQEWYKKRNKADGEYHRVAGYSVPFISNDGTFRLDHLPSGEFQLLPVPFNIQAYGGRRDHEVVLKAGETTEIELELEAKNVFYGRVLFENGKAAEPEEIRLLMPFGGRAKGVGTFDDEGYFTVHLSERELERLKSGETTLRINVRQGDKWQSADTFPFGLLAPERHKAGVLRIKRPGAKSPTQTGHSPTDLEGIPISSIEPFSLLDTKGNTHSLSDYKSKVVLLNIFTTWCGPCEMERPHLIKLHSEFADKGLVILAISRKEKPDVVESWVRKNRPPFPVLVDQEQQATRQFANEKGRVPVPTNVLLDRHHRIVKQSRGFSEEKFAELKAAVDMLTKQQ